MNTNFSRKTSRERIFGRLGHNWEYNIKMDLPETVREGLEWIALAQYTEVVGFCEHDNKVQLPEMRQIS
jgi:hypothetical protein